MNERNVILAGIPRSGTTLVVHLLNQLPDTVALHEPMHVAKLPAGGGAPACDEIERFFQETRDAIETSRTAPSKHMRGVRPGTSVLASEGGVQAAAGHDRPELAIEKELPEDYLVCVKHPATFTALLEHLVGRFPCYAIIRNPLSVVGSWNSVPMKFRKGRSLAAERLDPALAADIAAADGKIDRQLRLLSWFYAKFRDHLPADAIIRYEDLVASGGTALTVVTPTAATLSERMESRNASQRYNWKRLRKVGKKLLERDGAFWDFYSRESVEHLMAEGPPSE